MEVASSEEASSFQKETCQQNDGFMRAAVLSTDVVNSSPSIDIEEIKSVVDNLCSCVLSEMEGTAGEELANSDAALGPGAEATPNYDEQQLRQQQNVADESAKCRFGISANVEINISCKKFQNLLRSISLKMAKKQKSGGKRKSHSRKGEAMSAEGIGAKKPRRNASDTAGGKQRKTLEKISEFDEVMALFLRNPTADPIFKKCNEIQGMSDVAAYRIFHINQFLCHFITLIPADKLGDINNKNSFTNFNMSIVQKAVDDKEGPEMLDEKMMFTLATTVKYVQNIAQCKEGIAYARRSFPRLDHFLLLAQV